MFIIFAEAVAGGLLPLVIRRLANADGIMSLLNAFSGGVFLAAGLTHIFPHVVESAAEVDHGDYPLPYALVLMVGGVWRTNTRPTLNILLLLLHLRAASVDREREREKERDASACMRRHHASTLAPVRRVCKFEHPP